MENTEAISPDVGFTIGLMALVSHMFARVEKFNNEVLALPVPDAPTMMPESRVTWTVAALKEELAEFEEACAAGDIVEAADALIDMVYFALGRLVELGVPARAVFDEVQNANMAKRRGELSKRPGSMGYDAVKPDGWKPPDHAWLLNFGLRDLDGARKWDAMSPVFKDLQILRDAKGSDYNNVPGGRAAYFPFGHLSYAHMIHTKELRLQSLLSRMASGERLNFEGVYDTVQDLMNYSAFYAEALLNGSLAAESLTETFPPRSLKA